MRKLVNWKRIIPIAIILCSGLILLPLGRHLLAWHFLRSIAGDDPVSRVSLTPLSDNRIATAGQGVEIKAFGWSVVMPDGRLKQHLVSGSFATFTGEHGVTIAFIKPPPGFLDSVRDDPRLAASFSLAEMQTKYAFLTATLKFDPSLISLWQTGREGARQEIFLLGKTLEFPSATAIHPVVAGTLRGFEAEAKTNSGTHIWLLTLFDQQDRSIRLIVRPEAAGAEQQQEQVNAIVASIRPPAQ